MPYYDKKASVLHILIKFTNTILQMRNYTIVASFITWIFRNHVPIKAGIEHLRESKDIFYDFRQKEYNCPHTEK